MGEASAFGHGTGVSLHAQVALQLPSIFVADIICFHRSKIKQAVLPPWNEAARERRSQGTLLL